MKIIIMKIINVRNTINIKRKESNESINVVIM